MASACIGAGVGGSGEDGLDGGRWSGRWRISEDDRGGGESSMVSSVRN
jgi:hypothetical protein